MKYLLSIGLNDRYTLQPVCGLQEGLTVVRDTAARHFGGCTVLQARGAYIMQDCNKQVKENSVVCIVYGEYDSSVIKAFCQEIKGVLNQQSIAVQKTVCNTVFY